MLNQLVNNSQHNIIDHNLLGASPLPTVLSTSYSLISSLLVGGPGYEASPPLSASATNLM